MTLSPESPDSESHFAPNSLFESKYPNIVYEESDAEVVVVNLIKGVYYFLTGSAAFVWMSLHAGQTITEVTQALLDSANNDTEISQDIESFIGELVDLGLLEQVTSVRQEIENPIVSDYVSRGYEVPTLETYADLQDILLLDPVHDVDESGWPTLKAE